jgi:hypothetical protein
MASIARLKSARHCHNALIVQGQRIAPMRHISPQNPRPGRHSTAGTRWLMALVFLAITALPAAATGTLFCTIDDRHVSFELLGNTRTDYGTIVAVQRGTLKLKGGRFAKGNADFPVTKDDIILQWSFDRDLRFAVHVDDLERGESIFLAIIATQRATGPISRPLRAAIRQRERNQGLEGVDQELRGRLRTIRPGWAGASARPRRAAPLRPGRPETPPR